MRFALSDEQQLLREAARQALAPAHTLPAARAALDGRAPLDLWPVTKAAGWAGLLLDRELHTGAGLGLLEAMLVTAETGRVLAPAGLLGHLPATFLLSHAGADPALLRRLATGKLRAAAIVARPPGRQPAGSAIPPRKAGWTVDPRSGLARHPAPTIDAHGRITGRAYWIPDAAGADLLVIVGVDSRGHPHVAIVREPDAVVTASSYDASRPLAHVDLGAAPAEVLACGPDCIEGAWWLAQGLVGAEALGAAEALLEMSVAHAKQRQAFGRAIGSFQAIKHQLVEVLRRVDNARTMLLYAGWSEQGNPSDAPMQLSALRFLACDALNFAARIALSVHGGMGVTWEHDAQLYFRRAQVTRRLLGGSDAAAESVGAELLARATTGPPIGSAANAGTPGAPEAEEPHCG